MSTLRLEIGNREIQVDTQRPIDISIPLLFDGEQPEFFGAPTAKRETLSIDDFTGDTREGGSCNVATYSLTPHCNGTHTECLGHIVHDEMHVPDTVPGGLFPATLITLEPQTAARSRESSLPNPRPTDRMITAKAIKTALEDFSDELMYPALIIRTMPNSESKAAMKYRADDPPPFLSIEAASLLVELDVQHLLVDVPSVDRMDDGGRLTAHHVFWEIPPFERDRASSTRDHCTITEMIYVTDVVPDGYYLLDLQMPPFMADAAPSRPLIYQVI